MKARPSSEQALRKIGVTEQKLKDELINGEIFTSLNEAQILTDR